MTTEIKIIKPRKPPKATVVDKIDLTKMDPKEANDTLYDVLFGTGWYTKFHKLTAKTRKKINTPKKKVKL